jgi:putative hemolysin
MTSDHTAPTTGNSNAQLGERILSRSQLRSTYSLRRAISAEDVRAAQTLRFLVFNLELNEGLDQSFATCRDADPFDEVCDHLLVEDTRSGEVVGTYRLQPASRAVTRLGLYSAQEFNLAPFVPQFPNIVELGRACVHSQHRNLAVLGLLWRGIADYSRDHGARFLIGCSSLTSQDPRVGATLYSTLIRRHLSTAEWQTGPLPGLACPLDQLIPDKQKIPKLLGAYLSLGATICGPPAIDREFKTIDFLTLLDLSTLSRTASAICGGRP